MSSVFGIGSGLGFVLSGVILEALSWRWLFVLGALPVVATVALLPRLPASPARPGTRPDWLGAALLSLGLLSLLVAVSQGNRWGWGSPKEAVCAVLGFSLLVVWTRVERLVADPMVDMEMLARPSMTLLNVTAFLIGYAMFAVFTVLPGAVAADPAEVGYGFAASPIATGLFFLPCAVAMLVMGPVAGGARRIAPVAVLRIGILALTCSLVLLAVARDDRFLLYVWMTVLGAGQAICLAVLGRLAVEWAPADQSGVAGGINTISRTIGGAVAGVAGAAIVSAFTLDRGLPAAHGYTVAFLVAAGAGVVALGATVAFGHSRMAPPQVFVPRQASEPPSIT